MCLDDLADFRSQAGLGALKGHFLDLNLAIPSGDLLPCCLLQLQVLLLEAGAEGVSGLGLQKAELGSEFSTIPWLPQGQRSHASCVCEQVRWCPVSHHWVESEATWMSVVSVTSQLLPHCKARPPAEWQGW